MSRDQTAVLFCVVGNIAYAKAPVSRHGIKVVAQNMEGEPGREADRQTGGLDVAGGG